MTPAVVDVRDLVVDLPTRRGSLRAVDAVDLVVAPGTVHAIVGESGCGKTTLLRAVLQLVDARGTIHLNGRDLRSMRARERRVARRGMQFVPQDSLDGFDPRLTILQSLSEPWRVHRTYPRREWRDRAFMACASVGLPASVLDRVPNELSGGQRQRVGIARALALDPQLVLLDEPFASLDPPVAAQLAELLAELKATRSTAFAVVSHDLAMVEHLADFVSVMYLGRIVERGPAARVFATPRHPYTRALLAARPVLDPAAARRPRGDLPRGELPSPFDPPTGCRFRTRCPIATARCATDAPVLGPAGSAHPVACHFPDSFAVPDSPPRWDAPPGDQPS